MKLKIFSDRSYLCPGQAYESLLYPFWGEPPESPNSPLNASWAGGFDAFTRSATAWFELSALEQADLAIIPANLEAIFTPEAQQLTEQLIERARAAHKPIAGFFYGDRSHLELPVQCDLVFRNSLYRSHQQPGNFAYPAWSVDFTEKYFQGEIPVRSKATKPVVGFCGFAGKNDWKLYAKQLIYQFNQISSQQLPPHFMGQLIRRQALAKLGNSAGVEPNFIFRAAMGLFSQPLVDRESFRASYVQNIAQSDYILCCRGYGNYSFRFYETLSSGKIPVFINTDCVLPYDFEVDWKQYCVWVEEHEISTIGEKIAEFHDRLSPQAFIDLQHECRKIWRERLSPEGFYANLYRHLPGR